MRRTDYRLGINGIKRRPPTTRRWSRGFFGYLLVYQAVTSSAALRGYYQHAAGTRRRWR